MLEGVGKSGMQKTKVVENQSTVEHKTAKPASSVAASAKIRWVWVIQVDLCKAHAPECLLRSALELTGLDSKVKTSCLRLRYCY